jgi:hypothetical protein
MQKMTIQKFIVWVPTKAWMREKRKNLALMPPNVVSDLSYFLKSV